LPEEAEKLGDLKMVARLFCFSQLFKKGIKCKLSGGLIHTI